MKIIQGDLIQLAKEGNFDLIIHGCNCFNTMGAGIALQIKQNFPDAAIADSNTDRGDIAKLGNWTTGYIVTSSVDVPLHEMKVLHVLNCYTQYYAGRGLTETSIPFDYEAFRLICRKINRKYKGLRIGMPWIGCGLALAEEFKVETIILDELTDLEVTIVNYKKPTYNDRQDAGDLATAGLGDDIPTGDGIDPSSKRYGRTANATRTNAGGRRTIFSEREGA